MQKNVAGLYPVTKNLIGKRFGRLSVVSFDKYDAGNNKRGFKRARWTCLCECGRVVSVYTSSLASGKTKSCGCLQKEMATKKNTLPNGLAGFNKIFYGYLKSAEIKGLQFSLSREEAKKIFEGDCYYCGQKPVKESFAYNGKQKPKSFGYLYNGIDRVDNSIGYVLENCVSCCTACNLAKRNMPQKEFIDWARRVVKHCYERGL